MRARKSAGVLIAALIVAWLAWSQWAPRHVPAGQPALQALTPVSLQSFQAKVNGAPQSTRVILLLSPT